MIVKRPWVWILLSLFLLTGACELLELKPIWSESGEVYVNLGQEMEYYSYLAEKPRASMGDGVRLVSLLLERSPWYTDLADLRVFLLEKEVIRADWEISEAAPLTAGKMAYMVCRAAKIDTSMIMHLTVPSERYALRETTFHEIQLHSSIYRYVTGAKLLDIISKTMEFQEKRSS
jgi:hypothetical protein